MIRTTIVIFTLLLTTVTFGQDNHSEQHPIEQRLKECLSVDSNLTTLGMIGCELTAMNEWNEELKDNYELLINVLDSTEQQKLVNSQSQWVAYREKEFDFTNSMYHAMEGTMWRVVAAQRRKEIVKERVLALQAYYNIFTEKN